MVDIAIGKVVGAEKNAKMPIKGHGVNMSNHSNKSILNFLVRHAPKAPLGECMSIANDFQNLKEQEYHLKMQLSLLAEVLGFSENGGFEDLSKKFKDDKAILWALDEVSHCHAWVVCGAGKGMEGVKEEVVEDLRRGKLKLGLSESYLRQMQKETPTER